MPLQNQLRAEFGEALQWLDAETPTAAPRDEGAARELVAFCGRQNLALVACGNGTKFGIGAPPTRLDLRISTRHLNQIFDHDAGNATVEAGAGLALGDLNAAVAGAEQLVPLDDDGGTVGGIVACNSFGPSRLKWGAPRDLVVGLRAALSDGRDLRGGAKVVKNVAGYDLPKLFVGSFGSLGLITRVTLRLRARDAVSLAWGEAFGSLGELEERANAIANGPFEPTLLRASWRGADWQLRARFDGGERAVAAQLALLSAPVTPAITEMAATWQMRAQLPLTRAARWSRAAIAQGATSLDWDCGLGVARAGFADCSPAIVAQLRAQCEQAGGWLRVDAAPLEAKTPALVWGAPRADAALMRALKAAYDGANICAPGRLVGGI